MEISDARVEIPLAKQRLRTLVYICALVVAFSAYWVLSGHRTNATAISITGALALVAVIVGLKRVRKETTGLIIDSTGISNFSSDVGSFEVGWDQITAFKTVWVYQSPYIMIMVKDPELLISQKRGLPAFLMRSNYKLYGTPLNIALYSLQYDGDDLLEKLEAILEARLNNSESS